MNVSGLYKCQYPGCDTILVLQNVTIGGHPVKNTKNFLYYLIQLHMNLQLSPSKSQFKKKPENLNPLSYRLPKAREPGHFSPLCFSSCQ